MQPTAVQPRSRTVFSEPQNLADIRSRSCYKTLRLVINVYFGAMGLFALAFMFLSAAGYGHRGEVNDEVMKRRFIMVASCVIGIILLIAARQMCLLLIDIADTLVSDHNRNRSR